MRNSVTHFCVSVLLWGCVSTGKYDDLQTKYDGAQAQLGRRQATIQSLQQAIADREQASQLLQGQMALKQAELSRSQDELALRDMQYEERAGLLAAQTGEADRLRHELAELVKDRSRLKETTDQLRLGLLELAQNKAEADRRVADFKNLLTRFKTLIDSGHLSVKIVDGRMVLALPSDVLFDSGSAKLSSIGRETVLEVAAVLGAMSGKRFQVEGHTDDVPISTARFASNWELASARALIVVKSMVAAGVQKRAMSAASYGEFHPVSNNASDEARTANRRIEIVLVPDLSSIPGADELQRAVSAR